MSRRRTLLLSAPALLGLALWLAGGPRAAAADSSPKEYQVKAAFLYNFLKFVEWPAARFPSPSSPLVIAVAGKDPMRAELEAAINGRKINSRDLLVQAADSPEAARGAHVLFIGAGEDKRLEQWLRQSPAEGVLTVGESEAFSLRGGIITFVPQGDKMRFSIDAVSASHAGLKISAQLQKLARSVRTKE